MKKEKNATDDSIEKNQLFLMSSPFVENNSIVQPLGITWSVSGCTQNQRHVYKPVMIFIYLNFL